MKLSINAKNTIKNFSSVMTDSSKVISELIQNSRRAGASRIEISYNEEDNTLVIADNGKGVSDFENLITLSESGWGSETTENESPFGMGFFSTLFAASSVIVESHGKTLTIDTQRALNFESIPEPVLFPTNAAQGTRITLADFNAKGKEFNVSNKVHTLALYSSVDIYFNGKLCDSSSSLRVMSEKHQVVQTPFGELVIEYEFSNSVDYVCQDILIKSDSGLTNTLFLNNTVSMRMPDRDAILDADAFEQKVTQWLTTYWVEKLNQYRDELNDDVKFVNNHFDDIRKYQVAMLNEIDFLPARAFSKTDYFTTRDSYLYSLNVDGYSRETIKNTIVYQVEDMDSNLIAYHFFNFSGAVELEYKLDAGHWINEQLFTEKDCIQSHRFSDDDVKDSFEISTPSGERFDYQLIHRSNDEALIFDEAITITHIASGKSVKIDNDEAFALYSYFEESDYGMKCGEEVIYPTFVIGKNAAIDDALLLQADAYIGEFDELLDSELNDDTQTLSHQVSAQKSNDICSLLSDIIGQLPPSVTNKLKGKTFTAKEENGRLVFA